VVADQPNGTGEARETGSATNESPEPPAGLAGKTAGANGTAAPKAGAGTTSPSTAESGSSKVPAPEAAEPSREPAADTPASATNETPEPEAGGKTGAIPTIVTAPVIVVAPPAEPAPAPRAAEPAPKAAEPEPEPDPVVRMIMVNANHGARFPGDVVTVPAEYGAALARNGEAFPAPS
jgi:hypothetical protein